MAVHVTAANASDSSQAGAVMAQVKETYPDLESFTADQGFRRQAEQAAHALGCEMHVTAKPEKGFVLIAFHWRVERTFAWLGQCRLLPKDYEKPLLLPRLGFGPRCCACSCGGWHD